MDIYITEKLEFYTIYLVDKFERTTKEYVPRRWQAGGWVPETDPEEIIRMKQARYDDIQHVKKHGILPKAKDQSEGMAAKIKLENNMKYHKYETALRLNGKLKEDEETD